MKPFAANRLTVITISSAIGVIVGSAFLPALADIVNPSASPTAWATSMPTSSGQPVTDPTHGSNPADAAGDPSAWPTDAPSDGATDTPVEQPWQPTRSILDALEAEYQAQTWVQIADAYNQLCLDEGDYAHVEQAVNDYNATGQTGIAARYQALLDEHNALVASTDEQLGILNGRLNDVIVTHGWAVRDQVEAVYQAKLERSRVQAQLDSKLAAARLGHRAAQNNGLDAGPWQKQIDALENAKDLFTQSRDGF